MSDVPNDNNDTFMRRLVRKSDDIMSGFPITVTDVVLNDGFIETYWIAFFAVVLVILNIIYDKVSMDVSIFFNINIIGHGHL